MKANHFDSLKEMAFNTVTSLMGYTATWNPSEGGDQRTGTVTLMGPTEILKILDYEYSPNRYAMEYLEGNFPGLKEAADQKLEESIFIKVEVDPDVIEEYYLRRVTQIVDGDNYLAVLEKAE